jgi:hypothetical protein
MQPSTEKRKFGVHSYRMRVTCFLIAIKTSVLRTASYVCGGEEINGLGNFISEFTNLLGKK